MRLSIFLLAAGALALGGCASTSPHASHADTGTGVSLTSTTPIEAGAVILEVRGLSCPLCATNLDKKLEGMGSVTSAVVNLEDGLVDVTFSDAAPRPSARDLSRAVTDSGFTLVRITPRD